MTSERKPDDRNKIMPSLTTNGKCWNGHGLVQPIAGVDNMHRVASDIKKGIHLPTNLEVPNMCFKFKSGSITKCQ